jgi:hypothetical protein
MRQRCADRETRRGEMRADLEGGRYLGIPQNARLRREHRVRRYSIIQQPQDLTH